MVCFLLLSYNSIQSVSFAGFCLYLSPSATVHPVHQIYGLHAPDQPCLLSVRRIQQWYCLAPASGMACANALLCYQAVASSDTCTLYSQVLALHACLTSGAVMHRVPNLCQIFGPAWHGAVQTQHISRPQNVFRVHILCLVGMRGGAMTFPPLPSVLVSQTGLLFMCGLLIASAALGPKRVQYCFQSCVSSVAC